MDLMHSSTLGHQTNATGPDHQSGPRNTKTNAFSESAFVKFDDTHDHMDLIATLRGSAVMTCVALGLATNAEAMH